METAFENIDARILLKLKELGIKQAELGRNIGISANSVSQYCTGKRTPDRKMLYRLAKALGTSMEWLLTGESTTNENISKCDNIPLSESELDLLAMYRMISDEDKKGVFDYLHFRYEQTSGQKGSIYSTYTDEEKGVQNERLSTQELA